MAAALPVISGGFSIAKGFAQAKGLKREAKELELQRRDQDLAGRQQSSIHRQNLNTALNTIEAVRATRNVRDSFGTAVAREENLDNAISNENIAVLNSNLRRDALGRAAASKRRAAPFALAGGLLQGANTIAGSF